MQAEMVVTNWAFYFLEIILVKILVFNPLSLALHMDRYECRYLLKSRYNVWDRTVHALPLFFISNNTSWSSFCVKYFSTPYFQVHNHHMNLTNSLMLNNLPWNRNLLKQVLVTLNFIRLCFHKWGIKKYGEKSVQGLIWCLDARYFRK